MWIVHSLCGLDNGPVSGRDIQTVFPLSGTCLAVWPAGAGLGDLLLGSGVPEQGEAAIRICPVRFFDSFIADCPGVMALWHLSGFIVAGS